MKRYFLFSGGIDCVVGLDILMREDLSDENIVIGLPPPELVFFDYGQAAAKQEIEAVKYWADHYGLKWHRIVTSEYRKLLNSKPQHDWVFRGFSPDEPEFYDPDLLTLPGRNLFLLTMAAIALYSPEFRDYDFYLGCHLYGEGNDTGDCTRSFLEAMGIALAYGMSTPTNRVFYRVSSPVQDLSKEEILDYATERGIDLSKTWTCYIPGEKLCGECRHCVELKKKSLL